MSKELIAAGGVVVGALLAAAANLYATRSKVREVELSYQLRHREDYLTNARTYTRNLYVPLHVALSGLEDAYEKFRIAIDFSSQRAPESEAAQFRNSCEAFITRVNELLESGDAFLTMQLEERLRRFRSFLASSLEAGTPVQNVVLRRASDVGRGLLASLWAVSITGSILIGAVATYRSREVLAAPIATRDFESRVTVDIPALKVLIKEVTLGGQPSS